MNIAAGFRAVEVVLLIGAVAICFLIFFVSLFATIEWLDAKFGELAALIFCLLLVLIGAFILGAFL